MKNIRLHAAMLLLIVALLSVALVLSACETADTPDGATTAATTTANTPGATVTTTASSPTNTRITYTVTVLDESGNPVEGVEVQICDGDRCLMPNTTGADGKVSFKTTSGNFEALIKDAPAGYTYDATQYIPFPEGATELTVTLTAV